MTPAREYAAALGAYAKALAERDVRAAAEPGADMGRVEAAVEAARAALERAAAVVAHAALEDLNLPPVQ